MIGLILLGLGGQLSIAQSTAGGLFENEHVLDVTLSFDLAAVIQDKMEDRPYRPAKLTYTHDDGQQEVLDIKVKTRGNYRRLFLDCDIPPLRLNFAKKKVKGTPFEGQDKLKLVTHCKDSDTQFEQMLLQEYQAYRIYNLLTEVSFRVRLLRMTYDDASGAATSVTKYAFLIEDDKHLAKRNNGTVLKDFEKQPTDPSMTSLMALFQYAIGNSDWVVPVPKNVVIIQREGDALPIPVPYDFDWTGLVDAPYAKPNPNLNISSVRDRRYIGPCQSMVDFYPHFDRFAEQKSAILLLFGDLKPLQKKQARKSKSYLESFYRVINDPVAAEHALQERCVSSS